MDINSKLYKLKIHKVLFSGSLFLLLSAGIIINMANYLDLTSLTLSLFPRFKYSALLTTAALILCCVVFFMVEICKKWITIKIYPSNEIEIFSIFGKKKLKTGEARFLVKKIFSRTGTQNEVVQVKSSNNTFEISEFYISKYWELKKELETIGFIES